MTFEEIKEILLDLNSRSSCYFDLNCFLGGIMDLSTDKEFLESEFKLVDSLGRIDLISKSDASGEYNSVTAFSIWYFEDHDVYVKVAGYYSSYVGFTYSDMKEVRPTDKMITVYE